MIPQNVNYDLLRRFDNIGLDVADDDSNINNHPIKNFSNEVLYRFFTLDNFWLPLISMKNIF